MPDAVVSICRSTTIVWYKCHWRSWRGTTQCRVVGLNAMRRVPVDARHATPEPARSPRSVAQRDDGPVALFGNLQQCLIRVDRDRVRHGLQQRQVIDRIAVEPRFGEMSALATMPPEPGIDQRDLAFAKCRNSDDAPGVAAAGRSPGPSRSDARPRRLARSGR